MGMVPDFQGHFVILLLEKIDLILQNFLYDGYHALSHYLVAPLSVVTALYLSLIAWAMLTGFAQVNIKLFFKTLLSITFVYAAILDWGLVNSTFISLIYSAINELSDALISATPIHIPGVFGLDGALQVALDQFITISDEFFKNGDWHNWMPYIDGLIVGGVGYIVIGIALFEMIMAKVMMAILLMFFPLMAILSYWDKFKPIFDKWLGFVIGFFFLALFVIVGVALALNIFYIWLGTKTVTEIVTSNNEVIMPSIILGIISIGTILKASQYALQLGGVASGGGGSAFMGAAMGAAFGSGSNIFRTLKAVPGAGGSVVKGAYKLATIRSRAAKSILDKIRRGGE